LMRKEFSNGSASRKRALLPSLLPKASFFAGEARYSILERRVEPCGRIDLHRVSDVGI